jgi:A118 family predicted phage portal protein
MLGRQEVTKPFGVDANISSDMMNALKDWDSLFTESITNVPSVISSEAARLATIDMNITVNGGVRAEAIQKLLDSNRDRFRSKLELGCVYGGLVIKPTLDGIDFVPATRYIPIDFDSNGNLYSVIFVDRFQKGNEYFTRLEYHHFDDETEKYKVENKAFKSDNQLTLGYEVNLVSVSRWKNIEPEVEISGVDKPLFGYFRMPQANNIDIDSPLGVSILSKSVDSLRDFDMWYSKWKREGKLSDKYLFVNNAAMMKPAEDGKRANLYNPNPELIKGLQFGNSASKCIEEFTPKIRVDEFKLSLQTQLDLISVQCGFSSGYLSFDSRTGAITATQVESEDQRTLSTCTDIQMNFKQAIDGFLYALNKMYDLYEIYPEEELDINIYMKDLFVNSSEDRDRAYKLAVNGFIPKWKYLVDYEGYVEEEAKALVAEVTV